MTDRHAYQIGVAIRQGQARNERSNTRVRYLPRSRTLISFDGPRHFWEKGGARTLLSFEGPTHLEMTGMFQFLYYEKKVLEIDFDRNRLTDFGYAGYSLRTQSNLEGWCHAMRKYLPRKVPWNWWMWTANGMRKLQYPNVEQPIDPLILEFRKHAPWLRTQTTQFYFYWDSYDANLSDAFHDSRAFLSYDQHWRYFTYRWNTAGVIGNRLLPIHWERCFIDDDAKRRWRNHERKHGRPWRHI